MYFSCDFIIYVFCTFFKCFLFFVVFAFLLLHLFIFNIYTHIENKICIDVKKIHCKHLVLYTSYGILYVLSYIFQLLNTSTTCIKSYYLFSNLFLLLILNVCSIWIYLVLVTASAGLPYFKFVLAFTSINVILFFQLYYVDFSLFSSIIFFLNSIHYYLSIV